MYFAASKIKAKVYGGEEWISLVGFEDDLIYTAKMKELDYYLDKIRIKC
jgi:hypothetical protein